MNTLLTCLFVTMSSLTLVACDKPSNKEKEREKITEEKETTAKGTNGKTKLRNNPIEFKEIKANYKDGRDALDDLIMNEERLLIDFYAPWCGPCRGMHPVMEDLVKKHPEILVVKINTEEEPAIAKRYAIQAIPRFIYFKKGNKQNINITGAQSLDQLETKLGLRQHN